ncbi:MAG: hypothetical protein IKA71_00010 [Lentisphaeria bacterium]|nr:hypothetical protein [Lentisphaeria bacterium]
MREKVFLFLLSAGVVIMLSLGCAVKDAASNTTAENQNLRFGALFQSGAVLQRDIPLPVWGKAVPGSRVRCSLDNDSAVTFADCEGNFKLYLPPQKAGYNKKLVLEDIASGHKIVSENIAIGEVYLAAGQSNMEFPVQRTIDAETTAKIPADDNIRFFRIQVTKYPLCQPEVRGSWQSDSPETRANFSGVGYHFARTLKEKLNVPVGVIGAYLGGMNAETFISREALLSNPDFAEQTARYDLLAFSEENYRNIPENQELPDHGARIYDGIDALFPEEPEKTGEKLMWHTPGFDDSAWESMELPDSWTQAGYNHAGVFWFRKTVDIPEAWAGRDLTLGIGAADKCDETFFNGKKVGATGDFRRFENWNVPRVYTIPGKSVKAGRALIAVRVASAASICADGGLIGPAAEMKLACGQESISLTGAWKLKKEHDFGTAGMTFMSTIGPGYAGSLHMLYDNMIHPLIPFAMRGVLWYQGEANAICMAGTYKNLLLTLINDWRSRWGQKQLDFIIIQLPGFQTIRPYGKHSQWARLREAQRLSANASGSDLVVTLKYGDVDDIHPRNKKPVGEASALAAAARINGNAPYQAPEAQSCRPEKNTLLINFNAPISTDNSQTPAALVIAGSDGIFYPAQAEICNNTTLKLSAPEVSMPVKVRYAWSDNPLMANLCGSNGLPVSPFEISAD